MKVSLYPHQEKAVNELKTGSILCGGVGTGKSRTAIAYYFKQCGGRIYDDTPHMVYPKDLYIITTARKRDTLEWDKECAAFILSKDRECSLNGVQVTIDSWNNIKKYIGVKDAFFIFDEQRVVGYGTWTKSFLKITKTNEWILLSATPGDTWMDYIPVFIANGFYKNKTEFIREHVVYNNFSKFPRVDRYIGIRKLEKFRDSILVNMPYARTTYPNVHVVSVSFDRELNRLVAKDRWNPFTNEPIKDISQYCYVARRVVNSDLSRLDEIKQIVLEKNKVIIFYNYDYELLILRSLSDLDGFEVAEWNGHNHQPIPSNDKWIYLVQYTAGAEGWNCIETDTIIFYSLNYSYKIMVQAAGRIDRINTPFKELNYYVLISKSWIDTAIKRALKGKRSFNESSLQKTEKRFP